MTCLLVIGSSAWSADEKGAPNFDVKFGGSHNYSAGKSNGYYDISVFGQAFGSSGSAPKFGNYSAGGLADVTSRPFFFGAGRGLTQFGGSKLKGFNTTPLGKIFPGLGKQQFVPGLRDFNLVLGTDVQLESFYSNSYVFGLEYRALPVFDWLPTRKGALPFISSFVRFGLQGERQVQNGGGTREQAAGTVRALVGKTLFLRRDNEVSGASSEEQLQLTKFYSDYDEVTEMRALGDLVRKTHDFSAVPSERQELAKHLLAKFKAFVMAKERDPSDQEWRSELSEAFVIPRMAPDLALWADANGSYSLSKETVGQRFRFIFSANAKLYLRSWGLGDSYLQLQYVNGYELATPTARTNAVLALVGVKF